MSQKSGTILRAVLIIFIIVLIALPFGTSYHKYHGSLGEDGVKWSLKNDGTLRVYGKGVVDPENSKEDEELLKDKESSEDDESSKNGIYHMDEGLSATYWVNKGKSETIKTAVVEEGISELCEGAFANLINLSSVQLPSSLTAIGDCAFLNTGLTSVDIPASVKTVGEMAFKDCKLRQIQLHEGLQEIGNSAFPYCYLNELRIPQTVTVIGDGFLEECTVPFDLYMYPLTAPEVGQYFGGGIKDKEKITIHVQKNAKGYDTDTWADFNVQYDITE
ncbi:MAG: leucine-rich repeat domain-containing protein [Bacillota bacterium]|jgi:hypothetical protein